MLKSGWVCGWAALLGLMNVSLAARAEAEPAANGAPAAAPAPAVAPAPAPAPDLVRMKNGGLLRGSIAESVPGSFVTIVLLTGETRKVEFSEIEYAGPANGAPATAADKAQVKEAEQQRAAQQTEQAARQGDITKPFVTVHAAEANVSFTSTPDSHTLFRRDGTATAIGSNGVGVIATGFSEICTAPCQASLPSGTYTFGVSKPKGVAVAGDPVTLPAGSSNLHAGYTDKSGLRIAGVVVLVAGVTVGTVLLLDGLLSGGLECSSTGECNEKPKNDSLIYAGGALEIGGVIAGVVLIHQKDGVSLSVTPSAPITGRRASESFAKASPPAPTGLTFTGRF